LSLRIILVLLALATPLFKAEAATGAISHTQGATYPIGLTSKPFGAPPSLSSGVRLAVPLGGMTYMVEGGMSTPFTTFTPSAYLSAGPAQQIANKILFGEALMWRYTPSYDGAPPSNTLGVVVGPLFRLADFGALTISGGLSCGLTANPTCGASIGTKLLIRLRP
jgi:hypothetical protein